MDSKLLPWDDDEIVFLEGDWEIERSDVCGMYNYRIGNIRPRVAVDAAQLIAWKMAAPARYELLTAWDGSEIAFKDGAEVMRDILDDGMFGDGIAERGYVVQTGKYLLRVNKYYLVKNGYADGSDKFIRAVVKTKYKGKSSKKCKPWVTDDIVILPSADGVVERGTNEGIYRVTRGYVTSNWPAARLVEAGLAVSAYDVKLDGLCESKSLGFYEYGELLCGFWMHDAPGTVRTVRDIARLWDDLEHKESSGVASRVIAHNSEVMANVVEAEGFVDVFGEKLQAFTTAISAYVTAVDRGETVINELVKYNTAGILDDISNYENDAKRAKRCLDDIVGKRQVVYERKDECTAWIPPETVGTIGTLVPKHILPSGFVDKMRHIYDYIDGFGAKYREMRDDCMARLADEVAKLSEPDRKQDPFKSNYDTAEIVMTEIKKRKSTLDSLAAELRYSKEWNKKPSVFHKKDKRGRVAFTTGVKIDEDKYGIFEIKYDGNSQFVTANELIYLGLATLI